MKCAFIVGQHSSTLTPNTLGLCTQRPRTLHPTLSLSPTIILQANIPPLGLYKAVLSPTAYNNGKQVYRQFGGFHFIYWDLEQFGSVGGRWVVGKASELTAEGQKSQVIVFRSVKKLILYLDPTESQPQI